MMITSYLNEKKETNILEKVSLFDFGFKIKEQTAFFEECKKNNVFSNIYNKFNVFENYILENYIAKFDDIYCQIIFDIEKNVITITFEK